jgi:hypothetical protein
MCRNDKKLLRYELEMPLFGEVYPFEKQIDERVLAEYKAAVKAHEDAWEQYRLDNKTYHKAKEDYDLEKKQYDLKKKELDLNEYADEEEKQALKEPVKPTRPVEPSDPPKSPVSFYEMQSVGRVYFNLTKPEPSRWKKMMAKEIDKRP